MPKEIRMGLDGPEEIDVKIVDAEYIQELLDAQPRPRIIHRYYDRASMDGSIEQVRGAEVAPPVTEDELAIRDARRMLRQDMKKGTK